MWQKQLARHWNKTKSYLGDKYRALGKWAGHMDRAAGIGRRKFALAAPILDDMGQSDAVQTGMKPVQHYDNMRGAVMDVDEQVRSHGKRIASANIF
jgi:hypothetical protein